MSVENDLYNQVEMMVQPIIQSNAKKFYITLSLSFDEAVQEARIALMIALRKYDYNASGGGIYNFASTSVRRHFLKMVAAKRAQKRTPHMKVSEEGVSSTYYFYNEKLPQEGLLSGDTPTPEQNNIYQDSKVVANELEKALMNALDEREKNVFQCKINPSRELRMLMVEECEQSPTIPTIGKHLSLSKNAIDWSIKKIKETAVIVIQTRFSDLTDNEVVRYYLEKNL